MIALVEQHESRIADGLQRQAGQLTMSGRGRWGFSLPAATPLSAVARLHGDWLLLAAPLTGIWAHRHLAGDAIRRLLQLNASLPVGVKYCLRNCPRRLTVVAETLLAEDMELDQWLAEACVGMVQAASAARNWNTLAVPQPEAAWLSAGDELAEWFRQTGWPTTIRADGRLLVRLDVPDVFCQAAVERGEPHTVRLATALNGPGQGTASCRAAEVLLLEACHLIRMPRATARESDERLCYGWEVMLGKAASPRMLDEALVALSLACRLTAQEISAFEDESLARTYWAMRGWFH